MRAILGLLVVAATLLGLQPAAAQRALVHEWKAGALWHDVPGLWSGFQLESESLDINAEVILSPSLALLGGTLRPALGITVNTAGDTSHAYIDARWEIEGPAGLFLGLGLGAAIHDGKLEATEPDRKALGSRVLFHVPIELGLRLDRHNSVSVYFEHTSNGNFFDANEAIDRIGLRYGYRY